MQNTSVRGKKLVEKSDLFEEKNSPLFMRFHKYGSPKKIYSSVENLAQSNKYNDKA